MQQRVLRPCRTGISILWDPTLEREADVLGKRAALLALNAPSAYRCQHERHEKLPRCFQAQPAQARQIDGFIQCKLEVGGEKYKTGIEPLQSWGFNPSEARYMHT
ncbi:MAG TPA: hypothetical protein VF207_02090 [Chthoniobacterales bacterium]